jgi:hypothetical protein
VKVFTSTESRHVAEVVTSSREGGASLNILSGLVAGNFSAYWLGMAIMILMSIGYGVSTLGMGSIMLAPAVFAFRTRAFGFLEWARSRSRSTRTGPVTDNAQSIFELSTIEQIPGVAAELQRDHAFSPNFERAKHLLEANDGAATRSRRRPSRCSSAQQSSGHDDDLLDYHEPDARAATGAPAESFADASAVPARLDLGRSDHLLVHRRVNAGSDNGRLSCG